MLQCSTSLCSKLSCKSCRSKLLRPCPITQNSLRLSSTAQQKQKKILCHNGLRNYGFTDLRKQGTTEERNYESREDRDYGITELWRNQNFFMFLPAVGLSHVSGGGKGHGYGCKACFDRQSNDTGHRCDESASIPQKVFFLFLF